MSPKCIKRARVLVADKRLACFCEEIHRHVCRRFVKYEVSRGKKKRRCCFMEMSASGAREHFQSICSMERNKQLTTNTKRNQRLNIRQRGRDNRKRSRQYRRDGHQDPTNFGRVMGCALGSIFDNLSVYRFDHSHPVAAKFAISAKWLSCPRKQR